MKNIAAMVCAGLLAAIQVQAQSPTLAQRFEKKLQEYEAEDRASPPPQGAVLLVGDSQFFRWKTLREDLPGYTFINRGIDSFQFEHLNTYFDRLVKPYRPRLILVHCGGNDVHNGKTAAQVVEGFKAFESKVRALHRAVPIVFSSITPGPGRWDEADVRRATNQALADYMATRQGLVFVNLWEPMLSAEGQPREELWVEDRVHPNHAGYLLRAELTRPHLGKPDSKPRD